MAELDPPRNKYAAYRARKKAAGFREIRMWVPDVHSPTFMSKLAKDMEATSVQDDETDATIMMEGLVREVWNDLD
jgi:Protein  of unknown function (DUF3018)